jgi:hypothetical protein
MRRPTARGHEVRPHGWHASCSSVSRTAHDSSGGASREPEHRDPSSSTGRAIERPSDGEMRPRAGGVHDANSNPRGTAVPLPRGERAGGGGPVREPGGDLHGGEWGQLGLRGGRGRGRRPGCPLGVRIRLQDRLVREHGRGGELRDPGNHLDGGGRGPIGLRGGRGRGRGCGCPLGLLERPQDRVVREHGRGGELWGPGGDLHGGERGPVGLRGGRGRGRGCGCPLRLRG